MNVLHTYVSPSRESGVRTRVSPCQKGVKVIVDFIFLVQIFPSSNYLLLSYKMNSEKNVLWYKAMKYINRYSIALLELLKADYYYLTLDLRQLSINRCTDN